ncbi:MAG: Gfo/Idh/MocA family oxidoreductase [Gemmataceae bacterium]|nr:Gfo/Idh/MocA family oxidoreductase [Gemmataceae bacterium]
MSNLKMAVVGVGHLGKEHARILSTMREVDLVGVADVNAEQAQAVAKRLGTQAFSDYWPLLNLVDAACIVVPTTAHEPVAAEFLKRGISLLVEKPLAATAQAAARLDELAQQNDALLQVGHIERFNPAFEELQRRPLQPKYIRAERLGPFTGRSTDIGVVLDLMVHDLDLILTLAGSEVESVEAMGVSVFGKNEDLATARLRFANGIVADVSASRAHRSPLRHMHLWGPEGYAGVDFGQRRVTLVQPAAHVRAHGLDPAKLDPASRSRLKDELFTRHFETLVVDGQNHDQLTAELRDFLHALATGKPPRVTGHDGLRAVTLAERVLGSLRQHSWTGHPDAIGPNGMPMPAGPLFLPAVQQDVA